MIDEKRSFDLFGEDYLSISGAP